MKGIFGILSVLLLWGSHSSHAEAPQSRLFRQGNMVVKQLVTPAFDKLPLPRKMFAYYLSRAIDMGRDIAWHQNSRDGMRIRTLLEGMLENSKYFSYSQKAALEEYFFKVLLNHGNYNVHHNTKFVPEALTEESFLKLCELADQELQSKQKEKTLVREFTELKKSIFDENHQKYYHAPEDKGLDRIADSAAGFYGAGVTQAEYDKLPADIRTNFLSYPMLEEGKMVVYLHRLGGRFDEQLKLVSYFMKKAMEWGTPEEKAILKAHLDAVVSGNVEDLKKAEALWVQHQSADLDFVLGFVETYEDPKDVRGSWEGFILLRNIEPATVARVEVVRNRFFDFEEVNPFPKEFQKDRGSVIPKSEGAYLLYTGGANGETPFAGVNLPNWSDLQEKYGSKSFSALNVLHEVGKSSHEKSEDDLNFLRTFYLNKYFKLLNGFDEELARDIQVEFHEILGHGSGKYRSGVLRQDIGDYQSALEEGRAETASLYHIVSGARPDGVIRKIKLLHPLIKKENPTEEDTNRFYDAFAGLSVVEFFTNHIKSYIKLSDTTEKITQAHQWGRQVMFKRLLESKALEVILEDGTPKIRIKTLEGVKTTLGQLFSDMQTAISTGNKDMAKSILDEGAYTDLHKEWRKILLAKQEELNLPKDRAVYLNPQFELLHDEAGQVTDVRLVYESPRNASVPSFINRQVAMTKDYKSTCAELLTRKP